MRLRCLGESAAAERKKREKLVQHTDNFSVIPQHVDLLLIAGEKSLMSVCVTNGGAPEVSASITMHVKTPGADNIDNIRDSQRGHGYWRRCDNFRLDHTT